ncbi:leucine-rich repeat-containing G-protein coupled receptor 5-like [Ischnura elegans]|uniref:leucine-rich repeat-containing G-protein coupled receptor 5-like n=1 Tax=Ischnura elegans TaxID=197161 RepID=UPI001ED8B808|nr:leucine-rich repeat-containing G-protein coupled receptor 5-like [Ischnura elegans]
MSGAGKRSRINAGTGQRYFYIVITVITFMGCSSGKAVIDGEDGKMTGYHCEADPRCLCFRARDHRNSVIVCEDKVLLRRMVDPRALVFYEMECMGKTEVDPYQYLSMMLFASFSAPPNVCTNRARLDVSNCSAPSPALSALFRAGNRGSIGGWRDLPLEILKIHCKESENVHLSKLHWSGLEQLKKLTLVCPKLSEVDEDLLVGMSKRLECLKITETEVRDLPERFFTDMESMKTLDLRRNKLKSLRRSFLSGMRNLEILDLGENVIESIDDDIFLQTERLTCIQLAKNLLKALPTSLCSLGKLETLYAEYNRISFIPQDCLNSLPTLSQIYLNDNKLLTLGFASERTAHTNNKVLSSGETLLNSPSTPEQSGNLNKPWIGMSFIEYLRLDNNSLSSLPYEAFYRMDGLKELSISSNRITYLPENIFSRNKILTVLLASNNLFINIPATLLRNNTRLRKLDLSHNFIETLDSDFFSDSTSLCYIHINNNRIRHLPDKIFKPFEAQWMGCEEFVLDLSGNRLEDVPQLSLPRLTHLNLSENHLTLIKPYMLTQTPRLQELNLSHNLIQTIANPLELDEYGVLFSKYLDNLQVIDLSSNRLTVYPSISPVLITLKHLNLSSNYITEFAFKPEMRRPFFIDTSLETFDMSRNRLRSVEFFDHWLWKSGKMKHVDLSYNLIDLGECSEYMHRKRFVWGCLSPLHKLAALEDSNHFVPIHVAKCFL